VRVSLRVSLANLGMESLRMGVVAAKYLLCARRHHASARISAARPYVSFS